MQFVKSSVDLIPQHAGYEGLKKHIELCGRVAYKSEDKISNDSSERFVKMLINRGHTAPCEQGTVYLTIPKTAEYYSELETFNSLKYTNIVSDEEYSYITTNYRVILQNNVPLNLVKKFWSEPAKHIRRVTFRIICSRGVGYEIVRHRLLSFVQESTRYCNYSKNKHGNCIKFIIPSWIKDIQDGDTFSTEDIAPEKLVKGILEQKFSAKTSVLISNHVCAEQAYMELLKIGCTPQEARDVLPNGLKTELLITGTVAQWEHFLSLRSSAYGARGMHPDIAIIGDNIYYALVSGGYLKEIKKQ